MHIKVIYKAMPLGLELHPSFDVLPPLKYCSQSNQIFFKEGYEILRFKIKWMRCKNIYNYNTHSRNNDWLKAFKEKKDKVNSIEHQICC
jgi:hypothetical protein